MGCTLGVPASSPLLPVRSVRTTMSPSSLEAPEPRTTLLERSLPPLATEAFLAIVLNIVQFGVLDCSLPLESTVSATLVAVGLTVVLFNAGRPGGLSKVLIVLAVMGGGIAALFNLVTHICG